MPTPYSHFVFTVPHELAPLALQNKRVFYGLLFQTSAGTLLEVARDRRHLGAEIGFFSVLHTWNQKVQFHPHIHCVVAAGGLSSDHKKWIRAHHPRFFLPEAVLSKVFRGKLHDALKQAFADGELQFHGQLKGLAQPRFFHSFLRLPFRHHWVVYCKRPSGGPDHVLRYLGAYTHRVAISNRRLVSFQEKSITFCYRDSVHKNKRRLLTISADEFLRRFLFHVLPGGFVRIWNFGFLANRSRGEFIPLAKQLLMDTAELPKASTSAGSAETSTLWRCPVCAGPMIVVERFSPLQLMLRSPPSPWAA